jgi:glyoxylase-like metal-dependent hydrolase (beta-lactamase superfamily II)
VIGCWVVGEVVIDPGPSSCLESLLAGLQGLRPRALLLTHIHLDHAGVCGTLVARWPELEVYVHERGARHMVDPSRVLDSATRLYGKDMERLWGEFVPVPEERLRVLRGGERLRFGEDSFEVAYTPGHASHHVCFLHERTAYVGDTGGVRIESAGPAIPPTPPPDIDLEAWRDSLQLIRGWDPQRLAITHFGAYEDVSEQLRQVEERLGRWGELARRLGFEEFEGAVLAEIGSAAGGAYAQAAPRDQLYAGLRRYWEKHGGSAVA